MLLPAVVEFLHHVCTYTLQITDEALILCHFPDEKISSRLWNDCISEISCSERRATVSIKYRDTHGEYSHHFHSKQVGKVPFMLHWEIPLSPPLEWVSFHWRGTIPILNTLSARG